LVKNSGMQGYLLISINCSSELKIQFSGRIEAFGAKRGQQPRAPQNSNVMITLILANETMQKSHGNATKP
jgi:hypothetical protein